MNYIKVNLGGKERGLKFNNYAIEKMSLKAVAGSQLTFVYAMFYGGLLGNCFAKEVEPDFTFSDVIDWIDAIPAEEKSAIVEAVSNVLSEAQNFKDLMKIGEKALKEETIEEKKSELQPATTPT